MGHLFSFMQPSWSRSHRRYYQSVEQIRRATTFVFLRGLALLVPCFILLPRLLGTEGIWLAMPAAEFTTLAIILASFCRRRCQK